MNILYRWSLTKALIPGAVEPIVLTDSNRLNKLYSSIIDSVRTGKGKKIKSNYPFDLRLYFEFFENGMVTKEIGFTAQNEMFVNRCLYPYDKQKLKCLDEYIPDLTVTLGVK
ncbi:hypothetical protein [Solitalea canadensis]|nr:hypothetical protein [Solitalea canadensis]